MRTSKDVIILGIGGSSVGILDTINDINAAAASSEYRCIGFLDDDPATWGKEVQGVSVLGPLDAAGRFPTVAFVNGIGRPTNFWQKQTIIAKTGVAIDRFITLTHPTASVSRLARLSPGVVVLQNATIAHNVEVQQHVIVLPSSFINHDGVIGEYTCIAGSVSISGGVTVGKSCYFGSNSSIIDNVRIGDYCLIGIGSVVVRDVPENSVMVGNPGKFIRHTRDL